MRFLLFLLLAPSAAVGIAAGVSDRNPVAMGMALGFAAPLVLAAALLVKPRPAHRADPAKVARMEINLQTGPAWEEFKRRKTAAEPFTEEVEGWDGPVTLHGFRPASEPLPPPVSPYVQRLVEWRGRVNIVDSEAPTTVQRGPTNANPATYAERVTEHNRCPRPEGCVAAHPCRACGADKGRRCVGDPYAGDIATTARQFLGIR